MKSPENIQRIIRELEIHTKRLLSGTLVGDNRSAVKGSGFEFDQIREYTLGDDIRFIDWKASARTNKILVKQFIEERSRKIMLVVDASASTQFGSDTYSKYELMSQIASILALVANYGKDRIGLLLFSDEIEEFIPLGNGQFHIRTIMQKLFSYRPKKKKTKISKALQMLAKIRYKDAVTFLISDFIDDSFSCRYLPVVSRMYDLIAIRCLDELEQEMPSVGFLTVEDLETGELIHLDTRVGKQKSANKFLTKRIKDHDKILKKYGIDLLPLRKNHLIGDVVRFFRKRMSY